jgi:hypothetical protein
LSEKIDPTWLAYALERPAERPVLGAGIERLRAHYDRLVDYPTRAQSELGPRLGALVIGDAEPRCRWPHFAADERTAIATAYVPTGWRRLTGPAGPAEAPLPLARALLGDPDAAARELPAPFALAVLDREAERLLVLNDFIAAARLYEYRFDGGRIWSNRAAAPLLFAGADPQADERGWRMLAAASWLIGDATLLRGVRKVAPGTVIEAGPGGVRERATDAIGPLVRTTRTDVRDLVDDACEEAIAQARAAGEIWPGVADVDLSGGRDSRTVAGAVLRAGIEARFKTSDVTPGEADVARRLVEVAPVAMEHRVRKGADHVAKPHSRPIAQRALNVHLLHDGMRHPQKMRGKQTLPRSRPESAALSGHGGDVAHGFFYKDRRELRRIRLGGRRAIRSRVMKLFSKDHGAARPEAYDEAAGEVERILAEGRRLGVKGPIQLEWFYIVDRFANRQGVATHAERVSIFGTPAFVRAAFALKPEERIESLLHRLMVARLVPQWADVPFFKAERSPMRKVRRLRIWEAPQDAATVERLLATDGPWTEIFDPERVRGAWAEVKAGGGKANREAIFEGVVYREAFEEYLGLLRERSRAGPALGDIPTPRGRRLEGPRPSFRTGGLA